MVASRCLPLLVTLAAASRSVYEEHELDAVQDSASGDMRPDQSRSKKCDPQAADEKDYGQLVRLSRQEKTAARFWDACPATGKGKACPSGCEPLSSAISLSHSQNAFRWIGRGFSGACEKKCRYKDEYMLRPENSKLFLGTSLAVLQAKLSKQTKSGCSTLASWLLPGCGVRQKKIFSLARFVFAAFHSLRGSADCEQQLPQELRLQLAEVVKDLYLPLEKLAPAGLRKDNKTSGMQETMRLVGSENFCQVMQEIGERKRAAQAKDTEERLDVMVDAAMKSAAASGLEVRGGNDLKERIVQKLEQERSATNEDQLFENELKADEAKLIQLLSQSEEDRDSTSLVQLGFDKAVVDSQGLVGILKGLVWHLLFHGVMGSLLGALSTAVCWITFGEVSNQAGITDINAWWKVLLWIPACAIESFAYGYGITDGGSLFEDWNLKD